MFLKYCLDPPFERNELLPSFSLIVIAVGGILGGEISRLFMFWEEWKKTEFSYWSGAWVHIIDSNRNFCLLETSDRRVLGGRGNEFIQVKRGTKKNGSKLKIRYCIIEKHKCQKFPIDSLVGQKAQSCALYDAMRPRDNAVITKTTRKLYMFW